MEEEVQFLRRLEKTARHLRDSLTDAVVFSLFCGRCNVISVESVRDLVTEKLGVLSASQAAVVFQRLDSSGSRVGNFAELRILLRPFGDSLTALQHDEDNPANRDLALGITQPSAAAPISRESLHELLGHLERQGEFDLQGFHAMKELRESFDACPSKHTSTVCESLLILLQHLAHMGELEL
jgi:hypothetical protein